MTAHLAHLADRRARLVLALAAVLFVAAGAFGGRVAERLDPFGADDPATESVIADASAGWSCASRAGRRPRLQPS